MANTVVLLIKPLFHELASSLLVLLQTFKVTTDVNLINLASADSVVDALFLLVKLHFFEGNFVRLSLAKHFHFNHLLGNLLLLLDLFFFKLTELLIPAFIS
jgi:hypothetical protein